MIGDTFLLAILKVAKEEYIVLINETFKAFVFRTFFYISNTIEFTIKISKAVPYKMASQHDFYLYNGDYSITIILSE